MTRLAGAQMRRDDAEQIADEYRCAAEMADIGATVGGIKRDRAAGASAARLRPRWRRAARRVEAVVPEYERLWLARNRPGGLTDGVARLKSFGKAMRDAGA
jgi:hypothetical protein